MDERADRADARFRLIRFDFVGFLGSSRLAIILLVLIFLVCLVGVIFVPFPSNKDIVFSSFWFNMLLALLIINIVFCLARTYWRRQLDAVAIGLIIFHMSFILICFGAIYNSLYFFKGSIRLTEGETLSGTDEKSYDWMRKGPFFKQKDDFSIYFNKLHPFYTLDGQRKGVTNELAIGEEDQVASMKRDFMYKTRPLVYKGFRFHRDQDGFSPLFVLRDHSGRVVDGVYAPLRSFEQEDETYRYRGAFPLPRKNPRIQVVAEYHPSQEKERAGEVTFQVVQFDPGRPPAEGEREDILEKRVPIGERMRVGNVYLSMDEVRYWSSMRVFHYPGSLLIGISFWIALGGITMSTTARLVRGKKEGNNDD